MRWRVSTPRSMIEKDITTSDILYSRAGMGSLIVNSISLKELSQTLHLLHRRNKNQHRRSKWWKWFAMLHRSVKRLLADVRGPDDTRASDRTRFFTENLQPRCYKSVCLDIYVYKTHQL